MGSGESNELDGIAVVGMSGRFPGARDLEAFWENLRAGVESISIFSEEELLAAGVSAEVLREPAYVRAGGALEDVDLFDARFFGFTRREAEATDPQQRLFLECAWHALESAGCDPSSYPGRIGVYAGSSRSSYGSMLLSPAGAAGELQLAVGTDRDFLTTRVSYKLDLRGPSVAVQTACSTSLVAVCMAVQSLLQHQCDVALAGGVGIQVPQKTGYMHQEGGVLSPDGHCRAFDASAAGFVPGNGVGIVVLKRLAEALEDGDVIHAVIRGTAVNNDGCLKVGYTAPSVEGQAEVVAEAMAVAGFDPRTLTYVETHGTGTPLGDPVELAALTRAFRARTDAKQYCAIGSLKTNIGHLDAAAGIASLIKLILSLKHGELPPSLHFERPNPRIGFAASPFFVNTTLRRWERSGFPRRAGVSSFGIGGTNAHVVLEEAPELPPGFDSRPPHLLVLSAKSEEALERATENLARHLERRPKLDLGNVAFTLQVGRRGFARRRMVLVDDAAQAIAALRGPAFPPVRSGAWEGRHRPVVFLFPGQGSQHLRMGLGLYEEEPDFREVLDRCALLLRPHLGLDLLEVLFARGGDERAADAALRSTRLAQPALFSVQYALAQLWLRWGVRPEAMLGHSVGEFTAACLAGIFSLEDALAAVCARARLVDRQAPGAMLALPMAEEELQVELGPELDLAAHNAPRQCVVSGPDGAVAELEAKLAARGIRGRRLATSHAFHSKLMDPALEPFARELEKVVLSPPRIPFLSNVTGDWITAREANDPRYWVRQLRGTVRFAEALAELARTSERILLEVGPGEVLTSLVRHQVPRGGPLSLASLPSPGRSRPERAALLESLGRLWLAGVAVDWHGVHRHERRRKVELPRYPFERSSYWSSANPRAARTAHASGSAEQTELSEWFYLPCWRPSLHPRPASAAGQRWLVFEDAGGFARVLAEALQRAGAEVVRIARGTGGSGERVPALRAGDREGLDHLLRGLGSRGFRPSAVLDARCLRRAAAVQPELGGDPAETAFNDLLCLARGLWGHGFRQPMKLVVLTHALHSLAGEQPGAVDVATVLGACRAIPQEYNNLRCRNVDVRFPENGRAERELVERLVGELCGNSDAPVVAYRAGERWTESFDPVTLGAAEATPDVLRPEGVYLVTGGLGGIGLVLAEYLARAVRARLVLVGRRAATSERRGTLERLIALGAELHIAAADVSDDRAMCALVEDARRRFGRIHGVLHCAGVAGGRMIHALESDEIEAVFAPKVKGARVLASIFEPGELDVFVLFSSLAAVLGGVGQAHYCAANAFLDASVPWLRARLQTPVTSIAWDTWREVGMAVETRLPAALESLRAERLATGIRPAQGADCFRRILRYLPQRILVSTTDLGHRLPTAPVPAFCMGAPRPEAFPRGHAGGRQQTEAERLLVDAWRELLGVEEVAPEDNFFDLGGSSLLAVELIARLKGRVGVDLSPQDFLFDTLAQIAARIGEGSNAT